MTLDRPRDGYRNSWLCFVALALACAVADWPGLYWSAGDSAPVALTLGVALTGLVGGGLVLAPAIPLGLLCRFLFIAPPGGSAEALADGIGILAGAMLGAHFIQRCRAAKASPSTADQVASTIASGAAASLTSAALHLTIADLSGLAPVSPDRVADHVIQEVLGQLLVVPLGFAWAGLKLRRPAVRPAQHFLAAMLATAASAWAVFVLLPNDPIAWAVLPALVWATLAFHFRGATAALLIVALIALYGTSIGQGPFHEYRIGHEWVVQAYLGVVAATFLILAHLADGRRADAALRQTTRQLREREAQLSAFIADAPAAVAMFDREMRYLAYSRRYLADYGLPRDAALVGRSHYEIFPETSERWRDLHRRTLGGAELSADEVPYRRPDGRMEQISWKMKGWRDADGAVAGVILFSEMVTEAVAARQAVAQANALYRAMFEQSQVGIARLTLDLRFIEVNDRGCEIAGIDRKSLIGTSMADVVSAHNLAQRKNAAADLIAGRIASFRIEQDIATAQGEQRWLGLTLSLVRDAQGQPIEFVSIGEDVTARKQAELALAESEARLRLAQDGAGVGVWEHRFADNVTYHSPVSQRLHDLEPRESGLYRPEETFARFDARDRDSIHESMRTAVEQMTTLEVNVPLTLRGGGQRRLRSIARFDGSRGTARLLGLTLDVTEQTENVFRLHQARDQLLRVSRLSAMGAMASTLAHELNQPLAAIANFAAAGGHYLAAPKPPPAGFLRDLLERIAGQAQRAGEIVRKMRGFTISGQLSLEPHRIHAILEAACGAAREREALTGVEIRCHASREIPPVLADRLQIEQVIFNLIQNGAEATEGCARRIVEVSASGAGDKVIVEVSDTGSGMADEILDNLFEPFRTTKPNGTGLGLPICRTIVEAHGGMLWAESRPESGTIVKFSLKAAPADAA